MMSQVARTNSTIGALKGILNVSTLIYFLAIAATLDLMTLFRNIPVLGLAAEANPIALYFLVTFGPIGLVVAKAASVLFASAVATFLMRSGQTRLAKVTLAICCLATVLAILSNLWSV